MSEIPPGYPSHDPHCEKKQEREGGKKMSMKADLLKEMVFSKKYIHKLAIIIIIWSLPHLSTRFFYPLPLFKLYIENLKRE